MAGRHKYVQLIDVVKFALPDVLTIETDPTSHNFAERAAGGGGLLRYDKVLSHIGIIVHGMATDEYVEPTFSTYKARWKNKAVQDAYRLLRDIFDRKGTWHRVPSSGRTYVLGFWFKTSVHGYWAHNGQVYAVLINPRKSQPL